MEIANDSYNYRHYTRVSLYAVFVILIILFVSVIFFVKNDAIEQRSVLADRIVHDFRSSLDYEMAELLSFAMALAEDGELKNALHNEDEHKGHMILSHIAERFKKYTHLKSLRIQVFTPDFFIFARSWNEGFEGMPIWWFRDDLARLKQNNKPKVGMETGRLLTLKATVPIQSGKKLLGYLEVIKMIDEFAVKLRRKGVELIALMDSRFLNKATLMRDFPIVNNYVVTNQNFNRKLLEKVKTLDWNDFMSKRYVYQDGMMYLNEPMYNGVGELIGIYILAVDDDILDSFKRRSEHVSFLTQFSDEDIKKVVEEWRYPYGSFRRTSDRTLIELLPKLRPEDKVQLEAQAKSILQHYSKEELIDIILHKKHTEKKVGKIE